MKYDLVFEGGGAKGMVFVGAIRELLARGHTFDRLLGVSAGAIMACFLAAGYEPAEMEAALSETRDNKPIFMGFMGPPGPFSEQDVSASVLADLAAAVDIPGVPAAIERIFDRWLMNRFIQDSKFNHLFSLVEKSGLFSAQPFLEWLSTKLDSGANNGTPRRYSHMTLAQFYAATHIELTLLAADISEARLLVLNHNTAPDCPVVAAVRMSMSFPFVWPDVVWEQNWGSYRGVDIAGHHVIDGGLLSNFPIELFLSERPQVTAVMGPRDPESRPLGFLIDESTPVPGAGEPGEGLGLGVNFGFDVTSIPVVRRALGMVDAATQAHDKMVLEAMSQYVVRLPAKGYKTMEFGMSEARREALINEGQRRTESYLNWRDAQSFAMDMGTETDAESRAVEAADRISEKLLG